MNLNKVQYFIVLAVLELVFILLMIGFTFPNTLSYIHYIVLGVFFIATLQLNIYYSYKIIKAKSSGEVLPDKKKVININISAGIILFLLHFLFIIFYVQGSLYREAFM